MQLRLSLVPIQRGCCALPKTMCNTREFLENTIPAVRCNIRAFFLMLQNHWYLDFFFIRRNSRKIWIFLIYHFLKKYLKMYFFSWISSNIFFEKWSKPEFLLDLGIELQIWTHLPWFRMCSPEIKGNLVFEHREFYFTRRNGSISELRRSWTDYRYINPATPYVYESSWAILARRKIISMSFTSWDFFHAKWTWPTPRWVGPLYTFPSVTLSWSPSSRQHRKHRMGLAPSTFPPRWCPVGEINAN